ncbi:hypothetical protein GCM10020216_029660 [Nonomuraea helvata]
MIVGGLVGALAPGFAALTVARVVAGLGAAVFGPAASTAGSMIVPAEHRPRALATVFAGMTAATVLGVPLSASVGDAIGWRWTFAGVAVLTACSAGLIALFLPSLEPGPAPTARVFAEVLRAPGTLPMVTTTLLVLAAQFIVYGVAGAYLQARFAAPQSVISLVLLAFGVVGIIGNAAAARIYGRLGGARTIAVPLAGLAIGFVALTAAPPSIPVAVAVFAFWAFFNGLFMAPQQARLVELLPEQRGMLLAANASALYLGMSLGSLLGSRLLPSLGAGPLPALALLPLALATAAHVASTRTPALVRN